jgi:hypothetical protein
VNTDPAGGTARLPVKTGLYPGGKPVRRAGHCPRRALPGTGLARMFDTIRSGGRSAYKTFTDAVELRALIVTDLATLLAERFEGAARDGPRPQAPSPVAALVGRDHDIDEVVRLLNTQDRRLVVLTGAGGIGKTRLALAVMEHTAARWRDGTAFVDQEPAAAGCDRWRGDVPVAAGRVAA